ncbi:MAG: hypothetical protein JSY10_23655 [Paenibacillus sp.]|nr:hypothetical protein [Paenibacillus sp.]
MKALNICVPTTNFFPSLSSIIVGQTLEYLVGIGGGNEEFGGSPFMFLNDSR